MNKRIIAMILSGITAFSLAACGGKDPAGNEIAPKGELEFWSTYATEKIMQDRLTGYSAVKLPAVVDVEACKGEYESTQVIMTATKGNINSYNAEITELTSEGGDTFSKDNIELRHQVYIHVREVFSNNGAPTGWYPDALVPLANVVAKKENRIAKDTNQGLYITFNVPITQKAGKYSGNLKITYDDSEQILPVTLTIMDYAVSEVTHSMSYFNLGFTLYYGEMDSTYDMWRKYAETLIDYRISPSLVREYEGGTEEQINRYVDEACELAKNYGMSTINLPIKEGAAMATYIFKFAQKSIADNYNYIEKIIVKGPDEPNDSQMEMLKTYNANFYSGRNSAVSQINALKAANPTKVEFISQLAQDASVIPSIITVYNGRNSKTDATNVDTYCPTANEYDTLEMRQWYDEYYNTHSSREKWWYTCVKPRPPYPSYHTEDTLVSARALNWMMVDYGFTGNLYWAATVYSKHNGSVYLPIEDLYTTDADRWSRVNGDGYLLYPGVQYGIFGPVSSMRMEAIRDGNEDYEILYDLQNTYASHGFSSNNIQTYLTKNIYNGTQVLSNSVISPRFADARRSAVQLTMMAKSSAALMITDVTDNNKGSTTYQIKAKTGFTVKNAGDALTATGTDGEFSIYSLTIACDKAVNELALSVDADGKTYSLDINLGGKVEFIEASAMLDSNNTFTNGTAVSAALESGKIAFNVAEAATTHQRIRYNSKRLSDLTSDTEKLVLHFAEGTESTYFRILVKPSNSLINEELVFATIPDGASYLTIDLSRYWSKYGKIEYAEFYFSSKTSGNTAKKVLLDGMAIYSA